MVFFLFLFCFVCVCVRARSRPREDLHLVPDQLAGAHAGRVEAAEDGRPRVRAGRPGRARLVPRQVRPLRRLARLHLRPVHLLRQTPRLLPRSG